MCNALKVTFRPATQMKTKKIRNIWRCQRKNSGKRKHKKSGRKGTQNCDNHVKRARRKGTEDLGEIAGEEEKKIYQDRKNVLPLLQAVT